MTTDDLRQEFAKLTGYDPISEQGRADIRYVIWLEEKIIEMSNDKP
jgi:hypothetical protein